MESKQSERNDSRDDSGVHTMTKSIDKSSYLALFLGPPPAQLPSIVRLCGLHLEQLYQINSNRIRNNARMWPKPSLSRPADQHDDDHANGADQHKGQQRSETAPHQLPGGC